jgi:hypothetical protein
VLDGYAPDGVYDLAWSQARWHRLHNGTTQSRSPQPPSERGITGARGLFGELLRRRRRDGRRRRRVGCRLRPARTCAAGDLCAGAACGRAAWRAGEAGCASSLFLSFS